MKLPEIKEYINKRTTEIETLLEETMEIGIDCVINGKIKSFEFFNITPNMVVKYMESLGYEKGELDTNGWDYDWWLPFTKDGKSYTAYGNGYYGQFQFSETEK